MLCSKRWKIRKINEKKNHRWLGKGGDKCQGIKI